MDKLEAEYYYYCRKCRYKVHPRQRKVPRAYPTKRPRNNDYVDNDLISRDEWFRFGMHVEGPQDKSE